MSRPTRWAECCRAARQFCYASNLVLDSADFLGAVLAKKHYYGRGIADPGDGRWDWAASSRTRLHKRVFSHFRHVHIL